MSKRTAVAKLVLGTALTAGTVVMSGCAASKCGSGKCGSKRADAGKTQSVEVRQS